MYERARANFSLASQYLGQETDDEVVNTAVKFALTKAEREYLVGNCQFLKESLARLPWSNAINDNATGLYRRHGSDLLAIIPSSFDAL